MDDFIENNVKEKVLIVGENDGTGKQLAKILYDMTAIQKIPVGDGVFAVVKPYTDEDYLKDREEFIKVVNEELKKDDEKEPTEEWIKDALLKDIGLADRLIETLENYPDLPSNWKELLSFEDKQAITKKALNFVIDEDKKKLSLGKTIVPTACWFNGEVSNQTHTLRNKTIDDSSRYALIATKQYKGEKGRKLGQKDTYQMILQDQLKWELYLDMRESVTGFVDDKVPMRVGIMVIDYLFAKNLDGKK